MKTICMLIVIIAIGYSGPPMSIIPRDGAVPVNPTPADSSTICGTLIAPCGDIRAVLGPQGKNITVCRHGNAIAVIYGGVTNDPIYPMCLKIAYSTNSGTTWTTYGPFTGSVRRLFPGCDGTPDFCTNPGECIFIFLSNGIEIMIEQNVPSAPAPSCPMTLPHSDSISPGLPGISFAPGNPLQVIATASCIPLNGNCYLYSWHSQNGGWNWSDTINMGVQLNLNHGCAPVMRQGSGGYAGGIYINSVGGIINDGWPHFIESVDSGKTWLPQVILPVPHFDSTNGMFWWHEIEAEVVNNKPWLIANDIGGGGFWLYKGNGSPGNWTWNIWDLYQIGACSTYVADTLFQMIPGQYGSLCHDPVSGMILATYKGLARIVQGGTNILCNGPAVCGVYTFDEGTTWHVARPMSTWNTMSYYDWNGTETAHRLPNVHDSVYAYTLWIHNTNFNLYFERGLVQPIVMNAVEENGSASRSSLKVSPTISSGNFRIDFDIPRPGTVDLALFDATGRQVAELFSGSITAGPHTVEANIHNLPASTYFVQLQTDQGSVMGKILLIY